MSPQPPPLHFFLYLNIFLIFPPRPYSYNQPQYPQQDPQDGDRGIGGAITGGLAGGFGGHQVGHGLLGAIGGAILGSFAEDKLKKHEQDKKQGSRPHSAQGGRVGGGGFAESLSESVGFGGFGGKKN